MSRYRVQLSLVALSLLSFNLLCAGTGTFKTERPIFGILGINVWNTELDWFGCSTYVAVSNVKFIEMGGGRVVPIRLNIDERKREKIFTKVNGLILPGGNNAFPSQYGDTAKWFIKRAIKANDEGDYFPIFGFCLGKLALLNVTGNDSLPSHRCDAMNLALSLNFNRDYKTSRMFGSFSRSMIRDLKTQNITYNHHEKCISSKMIHENEDLRNFWRITTTNRDRNGEEFVSTVEAKNYPFYAFAWHPEKTCFEWTLTENYSNVPHSRQAVAMAQRMARFVVDEARKNGHSFLRPEVESAALVNNYRHMYLGHYPLVYDAIFCVREKTV